VGCFFIEYHEVLRNPSALRYLKKEGRADNMTLPKNAFCHSSLLLAAEWWLTGADHPITFEGRIQFLFMRIDGCREE
jgi:hypothetical protein